jgi:hypothetical protein
MGRQYGKDVSKKVRSANKSNRKSGNQLLVPIKPASAPSVNRFGRKSIRAIMNDLQKRIFALQANPSQWEALQQKVIKHTSPASKTTANAIQTNKYLSDYSPETRRKNGIAAVFIF